MTDNSARQPKGIPVGGQFAATAHAEPALNLTPRRTELDGWPESLPEPEVAVGVGDDNAITTTVSIEGQPIMEVWHEDDDAYDTDSTVFESEWLEDEQVTEAAEQWARGKHSEIARELRAEMHEAVNRSRARVVAKATGTKPQLSDEELGKLVGLNQAASFAATRDAEFAATAVIARGILKEHPDASHIGLRIDSADNGEFVSGAIVYNADYEVIGSYDADAHHLADGEDHSGAGFAEHLGSLSAEPGNAWWAEYNMPGIDPDDVYTIDLGKAAAWTPAVSR